MRYYDYDEAAIGSVWETEPPWISSDVDVDLFWILTTN